MYFHDLHCEFRYELTFEMTFELTFGLTFEFDTCESRNTMFSDIMSPVRYPPSSTARTASSHLLAAFSSPIAYLNIIAALNTWARGLALSWGRGEGWGGEGTLMSVYLFMICHLLRYTVLCNNDDPGF